MTEKRVSTEAFRKSLGLSRPEFSEKFGVPRRTLEGWEARSSCPSYVCEAFRRIVELEAEIASLKTENSLEKRVSALEAKIGRP